MKTLNAVITIAFRDVTKLIRDRIRLVASLIFPVIFIGVLGGGLNASFGSSLGFNYLTFVFTGVLAQTMFSSTASGVIFLLQDRETDFSKELFVAPVSRTVIVLGKIVGESLVSLSQGIGIVVFGLIIGVPFTLLQIFLLFLASVTGALLGGAFGMLILSQLQDHRRATQVFPFVIFPQFFLAGVFNPVKDFPFYLAILSKISPMTYAVDLLRSVYYRGAPEAGMVTLHTPATNLLIIALMFTVLLSVGTFFFARNEKNR